MDTKPYGDVTYADPGHQSDNVKRYPLDTEAHVRAAWAYINMPKNAAKYTSEQLAGIKARIRAAAKRFGIQIGDEANSAVLDLLDRTFNEQAHPRAPKGSNTGGEFAPGKAGKSGSSKTGAKKTPAHHSGSSGHSDTLSYDPKANQGTGYGSKGGDSRVKTLQSALNRLGLTDGKGNKLAVDGKLGPLTTEAVKAAQKRLGLAQDGKVTPALLKALAAAKKLPARRAAAVSEFCLRAFDFESRSTGDGRTLEGYAAVFNKPTRIADRRGDFDEVILPGAFKRSLEQRTPVLQFEHGRDPRVGAVPIGAIENIREDSNGLYVRARLYDNQTVEPVRQAIEGRSINGMSFRFSVPEGGATWITRSGDVELREIRDTDTAECGPVVFPAYDATSVSVRSLLAQIGPDEYRALLRELAADLRDFIPFGGGGIDAERADALLAAAADWPDVDGQEDPTDLTGRPGARSAGGGDASGDEPGNGPKPALTHRQRLDEGALRARGILK